MCAIALANYFWNYSHFPIVKNCTMSVEYRDKYNLNKKLYYNLSEIVVSPDNKEFVFRSVRTHGGITCKVTVRRSGTSEGSNAVMEHYPVHSSGVREEFSLYKNTVVGKNTNSIKYKKFAGTMEYSNKVELNCELCTDSDSIVLSNYKLESNLPN